MHIHTQPPAGSRASSLAAGSVLLFLSPAKVIFISQARQPFSVQICFASYTPKLLTTKTSTHTHTIHTHPATNQHRQPTSRSPRCRRCPPFSVACKNYLCLTQAHKTAFSVQDCSLQAYFPSKKHPTNTDTTTYTHTHRNQYKTSGQDKHERSASGGIITTACSTSYGS
jgi:hypothetical protein